MDEYRNSTFACEWSPILLVTVKRARLKLTVCTSNAVAVTILSQTIRPTVDEWVHDIDLLLIILLTY